MISELLSNYNIILASASPRRRQLLEDAGIKYTPASVDCEEVWPDTLKEKEIAEYLAEKKSSAWAGLLSERDILITADTIVWCNGMVLGKPSGAAEAEKYLTLLSGRSHNVITGICARNASRKQVFSVNTLVTFKKLTLDEIRWYISNYHPYDKAGAYAIQEWIGLRGITRIEGSYYNVVGMPVSELCSHLIEFVNNIITDYEK